MRITKKQSLALTVLVFIAFSVLTYFILKREDLDENKLATTVQIEQQQVQEIKRMAPDPGSNFSLNDFHRSETRNGKVVWEVKATRGQYFPETSSAALENSQLWIYRKDNSKVEINSGSATIFLQGTGLGKAEATQGVKLIMNDSTVLDSDSATFDHVANTVHIPGAVQITNPRMKINGVGLDANLTKEEFTINAEVDTVIYPAKN